MKLNGIYTNKSDGAFGKQTLLCSFSKRPNLLNKKHH